MESAVGSIDHLVNNLQGQDASNTSFLAHHVDMKCVYTMMNLVYPALLDGLSCTHLVDLHRCAWHLRTLADP
jgi:hypothetical protein